MKMKPVNVKSSTYVDFNFEKDGEVYHQLRYTRSQASFYL